MTQTDRIKGLRFRREPSKCTQHELLFLNFVHPLLDFYISVQFNLPTSVSYCKPVQQVSHKIEYSRNIQHYSNITRC